MSRFFHFNSQSSRWQSIAFRRLQRGAATGCLTTILIIGATAAVAEETDQTPTSPPITADLYAAPPKADTRYWMQEDVLKMSEFFNTTIPGTLKKYKLVFGFSPSGSDARKGEYIRMPMTLRYGLKEGWEIYGGLTPYIPSPINSGIEHRWGTGEGKAGFRYDWGNWGKLFDHVTVGIEARSPLGTPPLTMTDYYSHIVPFINTSRPLPWKAATFYTNFSYDYPFDTPRRELVPWAVRTRTIAVTPAILYKPGEFGIYAEYGLRFYDHRLLGYTLGHEIKAGPIWDIPLWRTRSWGLPGKWQIEYSVRYTIDQAGNPNSNFNSIRVRWRSTPKEVFSKKSYKRVPHVIEQRTPPPQD